MFQDPVSLSSETAFFPPLPPPQSFYSQGFWVFSFLCWNPGFQGLSCSSIVPLGLFVQECGISCVVLSFALLRVLCALAAFSTSPTSLDECFFNVLVVGLPYNWFSGSSGCSLFLNWLLSFLWLCKEEKHLGLHLGQNLTHFFKLVNIYLVCSSLVDQLDGALSHTSKCCGFKF